MAVQARALTVDDDPAVRVDSTFATTGNVRPAQALAFWNDGPNTVYIGGPDVTSAAGVPVPADSWSPGLDLDTNDALYAVCAVGETAELRILEARV